MSSAAMHIARTGLDAQDMRMRVISNNLANVNTTAFKSDRANFETLAYQVVTSPGAQSSSDSKYATGLNLGTGVKIQGTARIDTQGTFEQTGNSLDVALDGNGYFQVQLPGGQLGYTRAGNFSRSAEGLLVTSEGYQVQPGITIPEIAEQLLRVLARRLRRTNDNLGDLIFTDVPGRVAKQLLQLVQRFGAQEGNALRVTHDLTQEEIAQLVGASRETVNKALADFSQRGWIRVEGKSVMILEPERLARRAR